MRVELTQAAIIFVEASRTHKGRCALLIVTAMISILSTCTSARRNKVNVDFSGWTRSWVVMSTFIRLATFYLFVFCFAALAVWVCSSKVDSIQLFTFVCPSLSAIITGAFVSM